MNPHDADGDGLLDEVSLCRNCSCMTHTVGVLCGKCKAFKVTHTQLVNIAALYMSKRLPVVLPEFFSFNTELPDVIGFKDDFSVVYEIKVSRSDFLGDAKKSFRRRPEKGMGDRRYYVVPKGMVSPDELPSGWGLLYLYPSGKIREVKSSYLPDPKPFDANSWRWTGTFEKNIKAEMHLLYYYARRATYAGVHKAVLEYRGFDK